MIRLAIAALIVALVSPAFAQTKLPTPRPKLTIPQAQANPLAVLQSFTLADVDAALADAQANNDKVSTPCWQALHDAISTQQAPNLTLPKGVFSGIQKARDLKVLAQNALSSNSPLANLNIACAPLILDGQNTLLLLGVSVGAVAGTGGLALPAIPGILSLIPK